MGLRRRFGVRVTVVLSIAGATAVVVAPGCNSNVTPPNPTCSLNSDCASPLVCVFQHCHNQCNTSADCSPGPARCVPGTGAGADAGIYHVCQLQAESTCATMGCSSGEVCGTDQQCRVPCSGSMATCLGGQECATAAGVTACFDPNVPSDKTPLVDASVVYGPDAATAPDAPSGDAPSEADVASGGDAADAGDASDASDATVTSDAPADAPSDRSPDAPFTANPEAGPLGFVPPNFDPAMVSAVDGGSGTIMVTQNCSDTGCLPPPTTIMLNNGNSAALYVFDSLTVVQSAALRFTGGLPIVLVTRTSANIQGQILVNGTENTPGPGGFYGANPGPGIGGNGGSAAFPTSASGGGSYCGKGGSAGASPAPAAGGGMTYGDPTLVPLVGGSAGGSENSSSSNTGGAGGGAIEIVAGQQITVGSFGAIQAGGGAGCGYVFGGGGGAGGGILLVAPTVNVNGTLAANGGGGGEEEGSPTASCGTGATPNDQAAPGGGVGIGGSGSAGASINGGDGLVPDAGNGFGAGGGGAGRIRINTATGAANMAASAVLSPSLGSACATQGTLN